MPPDGRHITFGPRWQTPLASFDRVEQSLLQPLTAPELARGWTDGLREALLDSLRSIRADIKVKPVVRANHYANWAYETFSKDDPRWGIALGVNSAVADIQKAEALLNETHDLLAELPALASSGEVTSWTDDLDQMLAAALSVISESLATGCYLALEHFSAWDKCLRGFGARRREPVLSYHDQLGTPGWPFGTIANPSSGAIGERIRRYDYELSSVVCNDMIHTADHE
jgi:hypothetical protein